MKMKVVFANILLALGLAAGAKLAYAQTTPTLVTEATRMDQMAATQGGSKVIDKISADFSSLLGADSKAVVTGLRNGTPFTLTTTTSGTTPGAPPTMTTTTINPPTGKMGFGNVFISLALAKQQLGQVGITQPTPQQLQAALLGGSITTGSGTTATTTNLQGILTMRSQNMGWGQIAHRLGFKLGPVVSGLKSANQTLATHHSSSGAAVVNTGGRPTGSGGSGIVTGSGKSIERSWNAPSTERAKGEAIITGAGRPAGATSGITSGRGHAYGVPGRDHDGGGHGKVHSK